MGFITDTLQFSGGTYTSPIITKIYTGDTSTIIDDDTALVSARTIKTYVNTVIIESGGTSTLVDLTDVTITNPQNDDTLIYSNGVWINSSGGSGSVTSVSAGNGMDFTTITDTGSITLGTPSTLTASTTNAVTSTSHTHAITTAAVTNGGTNLATGDQIYDFVIGLGYSTTTGTVTSVATSGAITGGPITTSGTISHLTTTGYKHIPTGGSASQILQYSADGTAQWYTPPWTTNTGTVTSVATSGAITGGPITTSGTISHSTAAGYIHIPSGGSTSQILQYAGASGTAQWYTPPWTTNTGTVTSVAAGNGLNFTTITGSGSVTLGTPGTLSNTTTNAVTSTSHTHDISDVYLLNNADDTTSGILTASAFRTSGSSNFSLITRTGGSTALYIQQGDSTGTIADFRYNSTTAGGGSSIMQVAHLGIQVNGSGTFDGAISSWNYVQILDTTGAEGFKMQWNDTDKSIDFIIN